MRKDTKVTACYQSHDFKYLKVTGTLGQIVWLCFQSGADRFAYIRYVLYPLQFGSAIRTSLGWME